MYLLVCASLRVNISLVLQGRSPDFCAVRERRHAIDLFAKAESIIKCNTPDLPCTRPCRRPMGTRYQHLSAEERATIMIML
ncbi:hypothetical protein LGM75_26110, partial [Burkholderia multivorans]|nr:hypothetical protein [Burkholderia multivorans]MCA8129834.1 hypothetical protein [Burkholderia multivorans]